MEIGCYDESIWACRHNAIQTAEEKKMNQDIQDFRGTKHFVWFGETIHSKIEHFQQYNISDRRISLDINKAQKFGVTYIRVWTE